MVKEFNVYVSEKRTKDGKSFKAYRAETLDGTLMTCKFRKEITPPESDCHCVVDSGDEPIRNAMNVSHKKVYPELWIAVQPTYTPLERGDKAEEEINELF